MWPHNICAHVYACVCVRHRQAWNQGCKLKTYLTHIQTYSPWIRAKPHVLSVSTNCLICSNHPRKHRQAGLEIGGAGLDGATRASIESILWTHMGWWRWQLGEDLAACQAENREARPQSPRIQAEDSSRARRDFWNIWGGQLLGGLLERRGSERESRACLTKLVCFFFGTDAAGSRTEWERVFSYISQG